MLSASQSLFLGVDWREGEVHVPRGFFSFDQDVTHRTEGTLHFQSTLSFKSFKRAQRQLVSDNRYFLERIWTQTFSCGSLEKLSLKSHFVFVATVLRHNCAFRIGLYHGGLFFFAEDFGLKRRHGAVLWSFRSFFLCYWNRHAEKGGSTLFTRFSHSSSSLRCNTCSSPLLLVTACCSLMHLAWNNSFFHLVVCRQQVFSAGLDL